MLRNTVVVVISLATALAASAGILQKPGGNYPGGAATAVSGGVTVTAYNATYATSNQAAGLVDALQQQSFTWTVAANLTGNFRLDQNTAWAVSEPAQVFYGYNFAANPINGNGGNAFAVGYVPGAGDPTAANARWLQVIRTNVPLAWGVTHGTTILGDPGFTWYIDNGWGTNPNTDPFYGADDNVNGTGYAANGQGLIDSPSRTIGAGQYWEAWAFISTRSGNDITIYDGVHWGWEMTAVPAPAGIAAFVVAGGLAARRRRRA